MKAENKTNLKKIAITELDLLENSSENGMPFTTKTKNDIEMYNKVGFMTILAIVSSVLLTAVILGGIIFFGLKDNQTAKTLEFLAAMGSTTLGALVVYCHQCQKLSNHHQSQKSKKDLKQGTTIDL